MIRSCTTSGLLAVLLLGCGVDAPEDDDDGGGVGAGESTVGTGSGMGGANATTSTTGQGGAGAGVSTTTTTTSGVGGSMCVPDCSQTECGLDPVCESQDCGSCTGAQQTCDAGQCSCQPACAGKACGPDGCGGTCGACSGNDACQGGQCVCLPQCSGKSCGPDACGGSCGTCNQGACNTTTGQCVSECTNGQTECLGLGQSRTCVNGLWQVSNCAQFSVCAQGSCQAVCDGYMSTQTNPSVCFFPMKEGNFNGLYMYSNDVAKLNPGTTVDGAVWDGIADASIFTTNGTAWPWAWSMFGGNNADVATAVFKLTGFSGSASNVSIHYRARRTGLIQNSYVTRYNVSASNGSGIFASATPFASYAWTNHSENTGAFTGNFHPSNWNSMSFSPIGDGFGHIADNVQVSWFMLEVSP